MDYAVNSQRPTCNVAWTSKDLHAFSTDTLAECTCISGLMDKDDMGNLGFADLHKSKQEKPPNSTVKEEA